jgi:hypothetical protein
MAQGGAQAGAYPACDVCVEKHSATHFCADGCGYLCTMFADLHSQQKSTKNHFVKRILEPALVAQVKDKIEAALSKLDVARQTLLQMYTDVQHTRAGDQSTRNIKMLRDLFGLMTQAAIKIQTLHDNLVQRQRSLQGSYSADLLLRTLSEPHMFLVNEPVDIFKVSISHFVSQPPACIWGSKGSKFGQFDNPLGLAASLRDDQVYVCDSGNSRVQVFKPDGRFVHMWDVCNLAPDQLSFQPAAIAHSPQNEVFVIKHLPPHVQVFTPDGRFQRAWGFLNPGEMHDDRRPIGIAVVPTGEVVVLSEHVRVFQSDGKFIRKWEIPGTLVALCTTADRQLVVVSKNVCHVFDLEGTRKCSWGGLKDARSVSSSHGEIYVAGATGVSVFDMAGHFLRPCGSLQNVQAVSANDTHVFILNQDQSVEVVPLA